MSSVRVRGIQTNFEVGLGTALGTGHAVLTRRRVPWSDRSFIMIFQISMTHTAHSLNPFVQSQRHVLKMSHCAQFYAVPLICKKFDFLEMKCFSFSQISQSLRFFTNTSLICYPLSFLILVL